MFTGSSGSRRLASLEQTDAQIGRRVDHLTIRLQHTVGNGKLQAAENDTLQVHHILDLLDRREDHAGEFHLAHAQRITREPRELLAAIPGLTLVEMPESTMCCGSAGIYNLLQPETSAALLARKLDNAEKTGAATIVSANPGCMMQIVAGLRERGMDVEVVHIMSLLDRAYAAGVTAASA